MRHSSSAQRTEPKKKKAPEAHRIEIHRVTPLPGLRRLPIQHESFPPSYLAQRNARLIRTEQRPLECVSPVDAETWAGRLDERRKEVGREEAEFLRGEFGEEEEVWWVAGGREGGGNGLGGWD